MDLSNDKNLVQQLGLKPCPLCGNTIYIDSITLEDNDIYEMSLHCERCHTEYKIQTTAYIYDNIRETMNNAIDIWNERKDQENG